MLMDAGQEAALSHHLGFSERKLYQLGSWGNGSPVKATKIGYPEVWTRTEPMPNFALEAEAGSLSKLLLDRLFKP
jgi:hypothetical protein